MHPHPLSYAPDVKPLTDHGLRLWEIDALRGMAVILMVFFHFVWDLQFTGLAEVDVFSRPWQTFARGIGASFLMLLGMSLTLRASRGRLTTSYTLRRAGLLLGLGMLISLATYLFAGASYVRFGILHLLGIATLLVFPFTGLSAVVSAITGAVFIVTGFMLAQMAVPFPWLIWLGVSQQGVTMVDYYPLLPWAGFALLGVALARFIYPHSVRRFPLPNIASLPALRVLRFLGAHSLSIYLLHQPILLSLLLAARRLTG
jgi:uncharacterized membrane protein